MLPRVKSVKPQINYRLLLVFDNEEVKIFDLKPYLDRGKFTELKDLHIFNSVRPFLGSIQWSNELDLCPDTLYLDSVPDIFTKEIVNIP